MTDAKSKKEFNKKKSVIYEKEKEEDDGLYINVLIREKNFKQYCGDGKQKVRWLTDCAIFKYENSSEHKISLGVAYGLKTENGALCDLNGIIADSLPNGANVMVLLKEEYEVEMEERKKKLDMGLLNEGEDFNIELNDDFGYGEENEEEELENGEEGEEDGNNDDDNEEYANEEGKGNK